MATEKRLIDANELIKTGSGIKMIIPIYCHPYEAIRIQGNAFRKAVEEAPTVDAVEAEKYMALLEMYHELRENFIDYVCSGTCNVAPYCLNRCDECVDGRGWCNQGSDECHGFNPAEVILMDGDGNG